MPTKLVLILALVISTSVLIPLRRASRAFPIRSEVAGVVAMPRASVRRQPTRKRVVVRSESALQRRDLPVRAAAEAMAERSSPPALTPHTAEVRTRSVTTPHAGTAGDADDRGDCILDRVPFAAFPDLQGVPDLVPSFALAPQRGGTVPVPPPKPVA